MINYSDNEYNQAMLERMQQLEEALERAEANCAKEDDWKVIRFECGITTKVNVNLGVNHGFNRISK